MSLIAVCGKRRETIPTQELVARAAGFARVWVDLGSGTGHTALALARKDAAQLFIAVDAQAQAMERASFVASRKPARGGLLPTERGRNALFICMGFEALCAQAQANHLAAIADTISVIYPWGSLLQKLTTPDVSALRGVYQLLKPGGVLRWIINFGVFRLEDYRQRLQLPELSTPAHWDSLTQGYGRAGFTQVSLSEDLHASTLYALPEALGTQLLATKWQRRIGKRAIFLGLFARRPASVDDATLGL